MPARSRTPNPFAEFMDDEIDNPAIREPAGVGRRQKSSRKKSAAGRDSPENKGTAEIISRTDKIYANAMDEFDREFREVESNKRKSHDAGIAQLDSSMKKVKSLMTRLDEFKSQQDEQYSMNMKACNEVLKTIKDERKKLSKSTDEGDLPKLKKKFQQELSSEKDQIEQKARRVDKQYQMIEKLAQIAGSAIESF